MSVTAAQLVATVSIDGIDQATSDLNSIGTATDNMQTRLATTGDAAESFAEMFQMAAENMASALDLPVESVAALQEEAESAFAGMADSAESAATGLGELGSEGETAGSSLIEVLLEINESVQNVESAVSGMSSAVTGSLDDLSVGFGEVNASAQASAEAISEADASASEASGGGFMNLFNQIGLGIFNFQNFINIAKNVGSALLGPAISAEEVSSSLQIFTGSAAAAQKELQALSDFAAHTPFETSAIDDAALKMQSVGINAKDVIPYITSLGDALDATGRISSADLGMIVDNFDKIKTEGHLTTDVMNSFALQGIDAWSVLEKQTGKTHAQLAQLISAGLYPANQAMADLTAGIEKNPLYVGQMANDVNNFTGALSTMKSNFAQVLVSFGSPILKGIEPLINDLSAAFSSQGFKDFAGAVGKGIVSVFKDIGGGVQSVAKYLGSFDLTSVVKAFQNLGDALGKILAPLQNIGSNKQAAAFFTDIKNALSQTLVKAIQGVAGFINGLANSLNGLSKNSAVTGFLHSLQDGFSQLQKIMGGQLGQDMQTFGKTAQSLGQWFQTSMLPAIQQAMPGFEHLGSVIATTVVPSLAKIWAVGQQVMRDVMPPLTKAFETIAPIVVKVGGFLANQLGKALQFIMPFAVQAAQAIGQFAGAILTRAIPIVQNIWDKISTFLNWIKPYWPTIWGGITNVLKATFDTIKGIIQVAWSIVTGIFKIALDLIQGNWKQAWEDVKSTLSGVWDGIKSIFQGVIDIIWTNTTKKAVDTVVQGVEGFVSNLVAKFNDLKSHAIEIFVEIKQHISDALNSLGGIAQGAWNNVTGAVKGGINDVIGAINGFINNLDKLHINIPGGQTVGFNIPDIPYLASGGTIAQSGFAVVGERGPEGLFLPAGAQVVPNSQLGAMGGQTIIVQPAPVYLDGRLLAQGLMPHIVQRVRAALGVHF